MGDRKMGGHRHIFLSVIFLFLKPSDHLLFYPRWQGFRKGFRLRSRSAHPACRAGGLRRDALSGIPT